MSRDGSAAAIPRSRRRDDGKRERIIEAASALFGGRDLASVRMDEVASRAGVAKGTVYLYFSSKENLYFSILASRLSVLLDALDQAFREEEDPRVRLRKFLVHSSMFLLKYPDFFRMMGKEESRPAGGFPGREIEVEPLRARLRDLLRGLLACGMDAERIRRMPVEMAADLVFGALEGTVRRCLAEGCTPQRHSQAPALLCDFVWRALRADEKAAPESGQEPDIDAEPPGEDVPRLDGAVVVVTREEEPGDGLSAEITRLGGRPFPVPVLRAEAPSDTAPLLAAVRATADYAWILFTSARGVESFAAAWREAGRPDIPAAVRVGAVGPATARRATELLGRCDCTADDARGAGLAHELLRRGNLRDARILLARAEEGAPGLPEILRRAEAVVVEVAAYRTSPAVIDAAPIRAALREGSIAAVAFASPSSVHAFVAQVGAEWLGGPAGRTRIATIGPSTSAAVRALGLAPDAEAGAPSFAELARAAARALQTQQGDTP